MIQIRWRLQGALLGALTACSDREVGAGAAVVAAERGDTNTARRELLRLAFRVAAAIPADPHVKTRCRVMEDVVGVSLTAGEVALARQWIPAIDNWRRGVAWCDLAAWCSAQGDRAAAELHLKNAAAVMAERGTDTNEQAWRVERIQARIAEVRAGLVAVDTAVHDGATSVDDQLAAIDATLATGGFDEARAALRACADLFARCFADGARRVALQRRIEEAYPRLPADVRVDLLARIASIAIEHGDPARARALLDRAAALVDGARWLPEQEIALAARLAALRHRAGETARATAELARLVGCFDARRAVILDIARATVLRALASAALAVGDPEGAQGLLARAVAAGTENPNARPRAEDLVATCLQMVREGPLPSPELTARLRAVADALGDPW